MLPQIAAGPVVYPTVLARFGRFIPELMPRVMQMRHEENKKMAHERAENPLPHIPHSLRNVPSENLGAQRKMQDKMRMALDDMHRQIIDDVSAFIDNKMKDIGWLTSPVNIDYIASDISRNAIMLAYDKVQLIALLKLLTYFAIVIDTGEVPEVLLDNIKDWYDTALPLLQEIKVKKTDLKLFDPAAQGLKKPGKVRLLNHVKDAMKEARRVLRTDPVKTELTKSPDFRKALSAILDKLYTYFNSDSESAYEYLTQNIHNLGDSELDALMMPVFNGNPRTEAAKLASMVSRHGGKGHALSKEQGAALKQKNLDAHQVLYKQAGVVRSAIRTVVKKAIRESGQKLMRSRDVAKLLADSGLPAVGYSIPEGFDPGYYDQDMQMYSPQKELLEKRVAGNGWVKWHSTGHNLTSVGKYKTPEMQKEATLSTMEHVAGKGEGGRQVDKYAHYEANKANIEKLAKRWVADSQSDDPIKEILGYMTMALYFLSIRVGGGKTGDLTTYGLTTLQVGHVKHRGNDLAFEFPGKSGVNHSLKLTATSTQRRNLIDFVLEKADGKQRRDRLWTYGPNNNKPVTEGMINKYLESTGWTGSAKDFRTFTGTQLMEGELKNAPGRFNSKQNAIKWMINALTKVGIALGHKSTKADGTVVSKWQTAAGSYVNPQLIVDFFHKYHVHPLPNWIARFDRGGDDED